MKYFDTDVLINATVLQDSTKHNQANGLIEKAIIDNTFQISWLSIQEVGFVLAKLKESQETINVSLNQLISSLPANYDHSIFIRAIELAN